MILATRDGVFSYDPHESDEKGQGEAQRLGLAGKPVTHVSHNRDGVLASVPKDGLYAIRGGETQQLYEGDVRSCAVGPNGVLFLGIEPAMVFRSDDAGASWQRCDAIDQLPTRDTWTFPPPPHQPHVLSIDFLPGEPDAVLAGVEVGGVLLSRDGGRTWCERNEGIYVDVHSVRPDPTRPGHLVAVTGGGYYASEDGGESWERRMEGMGNGYTIGLAAHPLHTGELLVASGDRPPGLNACIYHTTDAGKSWAELTGDLLAGPHKWAPVPCFTHGAAWLGTDRGKLLRAEDPRGQWEAIADVGAAIHAIAGEGIPSSVMH